MAKADFDEFVKRQQPAPPEEVIDWAAQRDEWLAWLEQLYDKIRGYLQPYIAAGQATVDYRRVQLNEEYIGAYDAREMALKIGRNQITFTPVGTMLIAMKGRVNVTGPAGNSRLFLINKKAYDARSFIQIRVSVNGNPPPPIEPPKEPIEWAWKIGSNPPSLTFIDLTEDAFFDMVLEISNG